MANNGGRLFTGLQPSGELHLGNYFGAILPFLDICSDYGDSMMMVADYHALTTLKNAHELRSNIINAVAGYIAAGVDPDKTVIFQQSAIPEHTELAWIFECLVPVHFLELAHAYKDKVSRGLEANAGLFNYPMLMAADILLYDATAVPVGQDQRQHIEYAREAASKFNNAFGVDLLTPPREHIIDSTAIVPGTDGKKMSKSYKNTIPLFGSDDAIRSAVMDIVTDSKAKGEPLDPETDTVFALHRLFSVSDLDKLGDEYRSGAIGYKQSKEILWENIIRAIRPMRDVKEAMTESYILDILNSGSEIARTRAEMKMGSIRKAVGVK